MSNDRPTRSPRPSAGGNRTGTGTRGSKNGAPARSSDGRPPRSGKPDGRSGSSKPGAGRSNTGRPGSARPGSGRSGSGRPGTGKPGTGRPGGDRRRNDDRRQERPLTEAERRALEVKMRRAPRTPRDPATEREKIENRTLETWIDDGSVRDEARSAANRAAGAAPPARTKRPPRPLDPEIASELTDALGKQRGDRLAERLAQASDALDRERYQEARRIAGAIAKEAPDVAAAHEVVGLASYRLGLYKPAVRSLEMAFDLRSDPSILPVIADCYRALGRWNSVDRVWREIRELSPSHEVLAEGRIVAAGALADQGDLRGAIAVMQPATKRAKTVRDHHLRQFYVLGDLYDRVGDPIAARRWFTTIAEIDPEFADVDHRLRALGR